MNEKDESEFDAHQKFMQRAFEISILGHPSPNPYVGAVIVKNGEIIGEGYHKKAGLNHAEVEAILDAKKRYADANDTDSSEKMKKIFDGATLYVTLEPCNHTGKTPPCTKAIIDAGIKKVVFSLKDPNENVKGGGKLFLEKNGVEVIGGILEEYARAVNNAYLKVLAQKMPLVTLKMACTLDGKTYISDKYPRQISSEQSQNIVMKMRDKADAIMVGIGTVIKDNPKLTARTNKEYQDPLRVVVDSKLRSVADMNVFSDSNVVVAYCTSEDAKIQQFEKNDIRLIKCPQDKTGRVDLHYLLKELAKMGINQVLCEGGSTLARSLLDKNLIDVMILFYAPIIAPDGQKLIFRSMNETDKKQKNEISEVSDYIKNAKIVNAIKCADDLMVVLNLR